MHANAGRDKLAFSTLRFGPLLTGTWSNFEAGSRQAGLLKFSLSSQNKQGEQKGQDHFEQNEVKNDQT
jgi:hypothetical protein